MLSRAYTLDAATKRLVESVAPQRSHRKDTRCTLLATSGELPILGFEFPYIGILIYRSLRSVRRECLDHIVVLHEIQEYRVLKSYVEYFNHIRPHQDIKQQIPESLGSPIPPELSGDQVIALPILGGLYHNYRRTASMLESVLRDGCD